MTDFITALSMIRIIQSMQQALKLGKAIDLSDFDPDAEEQDYCLVYDASRRQTDMEAEFPGNEFYPVVHCVRKAEDGCAEIVPCYYKDTAGFSVYYACPVKRNPKEPECVIIPLADDNSVWVQIEAGGWSIENDEDVPVWINAIPVVLGDGPSTRFELTGDDD